MRKETELDGLLYRSRLTGANCVMVYDRAVTDGLVAKPAMGLEQAPGMKAAFEALSIKVETSGPG